MTEALTHRGPAEDGYLFAPGMGLGHRRLTSSASSTAGSRSTMRIARCRDVHGELFREEELRRSLMARSRLQTATDTEVLVHLYEEQGEMCLPASTASSPSSCQLRAPHRPACPRPRRHARCFGRARAIGLRGSEPKPSASGDVTPICVGAGSTRFQFFLPSADAGRVRRINAAFLAIISSCLQARSPYGRKSSSAVLGFRVPKQGQEENPDDITPARDHSRPHSTSRRSAVAAPLSGVGI